MDAMQISLSGLDVEWRRLEIVAQNLANMSSSSSVDQPAFRPLSLISGPSLSFSAMMGDKMAAAKPGPVRILGVQEQANGVRQAYEPENPSANAEGFVSYTNIDHAAEMTLMIKASRAYEANLAAITIAQGMYAKALEIGR